MKYHTPQGVYHIFKADISHPAGIVQYGGVAQLGERLTGSQKVIGSTPTVSTKKSEVIKPRTF